MSESIEGGVVGGWGCGGCGDEGDRMSFCCFKQQTAYEMLSSLVGSEMCIRDRPICIIINNSNRDLGKQFIRIKIAKRKPEQSSQYYRKRCAPKQSLLVTQYAPKFIGKQMPKHLKPPCREDVSL